MVHKISVPILHTYEIIVTKLSRHFIFFTMTTSNVCRLTKGFCINYLVLRAVTKFPMLAGWVWQRWCQNPCGQVDIPPLTGHDEKHFGTIYLVKRPAPSIKSHAKITGTQ